MTAIAPSRQAHNADLAVAAAERACSISGWGYGSFLGTLAAADARAGDFQRAQGWQHVAIALASPPDRAQEDSRLCNFQEHRAYIDLELNPVGGTLSEEELAEFDLEAVRRKVTVLIGGIPRDLLPSSFWSDIGTYLELSGKPAKNIFDTTAAKQLRPDTLVRYREVAWRTASAQVHAGRSPAAIVNLSALLDIHWLKEGLNWQRARAGDKFLKDHLNMAAAWLSMADNYVHPGEAVRDAIRGEIFDFIERELGPAEFSDKNMKKLDQFSSPEVVNEFLYLPYRILSEIKKKKAITVEDATEMMAAVAIELLLATMVRRKNLAHLDLSKHFWPVAPTKDNKWHILIEQDEVKNKQPLRFSLQKQTIALLQFYMAKCRPLLKAKATNMLFLRTDGTPKGRCMVADLVKRTIRRRLDLDVNVHLFRHIGTMIYLDAHPGDFGVPKVMLGHKWQTTTEKFYARLCATKAIEHFTTVVLGERNARLTKLKIA